MRERFTILGVEINNKVITELGKFAILWNSFEKFYCNNSFNPNNILVYQTNVQNFEINLNDVNLIHKEKAIYNALNKYFTSRLSSRDNIDKYLYSSERKQNDFEWVILEKYYVSKSQNCEDLFNGTLLTVYRVRCNLMHGEKCHIVINDQLEIFKAVNEYLKYFVNYSN